MRLSFFFSVLACAVSASSLSSSCVTVFSAKHVACTPIGSPQNELLVFFGGSKSKPSNAPLYAFYDAAAALGFHVVSVAYPDTPTVAAACSGQPSTCFWIVRQKRMYGDGGAMPALRHLVSELAATVQPGMGWDQFLTGSAVDFSKVVTAGHSQGAGNAVMVGKAHGVLGVVQLSGVDNVDSIGNPAPWIVERPSLTPTARYFGLGNGNGFAVNQWCVNWPALNMTGWRYLEQPGCIGPEAGAQMICSCASVPHPKKEKLPGLAAHMATVANASLYKDVWEYMLTRGEGASGQQSACAVQVLHDINRTGCKC